jgi:hypothetical protein
MGSTKQGVNPKANAAADGQPQQKRGSKYRKSLKLDRPINSGITLAQLPAKVDTPQPLPLMEGAGSQPTISSPSTESDDHSPGSSIPAATGLHSSRVAVRIRSTLVMDLATLRQDVQSHASSGDLVLGLTECTWAGATTPDRPSALIPPNHPAPLRRHVPTVDQDNTAHGESMFLLSHRIAPGSKGHFWFLLDSPATLPVSTCVLIGRVVGLCSKSKLFSGLGSQMYVFSPEYNCRSGVCRYK